MKSILSPLIFLLTFSFAQAKTAAPQKAVDIIKNKFNMNPLLISYNTHYNTLVGIRNLQNLKTKFGCDLIQCGLIGPTAE